MIRRSFVLCTASASLMPGVSFAADTVTGRFAGQRKEAKLDFASAHARDGSSGKDAVVIVLTEKDHSSSKNPAHDAEFGEFGNAATISVYKPAGDVFETQLVNSGFPQNPVTVVGPIKGKDVKFIGNRVEGRFTSNGPITMFEGRPYEIVFDLDIHANAEIHPKSV